VTSVFAQSPEKMSYQAVIRDAGGLLVTSQVIGMEINIYQGTSTGTLVYTETQTPTTNANGLISIEIGGGAGFSTINWASDNYYIEIKTAVVAPLTTYTITGTSQLLSVPYALHAKSAESFTGTIIDLDPLLARIEALEESNVLNFGFTDSRDGNHYDVVKIGNQIWMAENLKYLPDVVGLATGSQTIPYNYVYDYDGTVIADAKATTNYATYGVLYNWPATMAGSASSVSDPSGVQGVCPTGWHLPSDAEWTTLITYLGGESVAGGKLKETGTTHWNSPNTGATNETGFTALPGGHRSSNGALFGIGNNGYCWSATASSTTSAYYWRMGYDYSDVYRVTIGKELGFSVRCVRQSGTFTLIGD